MTEPTQDGLSLQEKKVLLALTERDAQTPEELLKSGGFGQTVEVMNAASWLQAKGLVSIAETVTSFYSLAKKQWAHKDLPERRALKFVNKRRGSCTIKELGESGKVKEKEVGIAVGWLKRKGWANVEKVEGEKCLVMTAEGRKALDERGADEKLIERLAKGDISEHEAPADLLKKLKSRQDIISEREVVKRTIELTEAGRKMAAAGLDLRDEVAQLTPRMLATGKWKDFQFKRYDVGVFAPAAHGGRPHPMRLLIDDIRQIFLEMGFTEIEGDYVESCFWNMDVLFIPQDHPARELQDTLYVKDSVHDVGAEGELADKVKAIHQDGGGTGSSGWGYAWSPNEAARKLLRTHTTVNTIRYLSEHPDPPVKVFSIGKVFRKEAVDATHLPEFMQIEGIIMEEGANFPMLQGVLVEFYKRMGFEKVRLRPAFFPYTEPSMEIEVKWKGAWMELGGSGIFRPEVTAPFGVKHPVLAWGLGLERLAMNVLGIKDIRDLYISDTDWLKSQPMI